MTSYPTDNTMIHLSGKHEHMLLHESGIDPGVTKERGYYTARQRSEVPEAFADYQRRLGLVVPMFSPDGETVGYQLRPDKPRKGGPKYETPGGISPVVDVHPRMLEEARTGDGPLLITEGAKTGDAATSRGVCTVVLAGVWMWCVPKVKPYRLKPCFDHIRLEGREVFVAFDSDCMSKVGVQDALAALVAALVARGASVKVIYLPDAADGSKQGVDDYLAAGGTIREMFMLARKFDPEDLGRIRLSRNEKLLAGVRYLRRDWHERDWQHFEGAADKGNWQRGHTARDTKHAFIELAARTGTPDASGVVVEVGLRKLSRLAAKSIPSVSTAIKHLEADEQLEVLPAKDRAKARRYRLLVPRAAFAHYGERRAKTEAQREAKRAQGERESNQGVKGLRAPSAPRLRWSSPARIARLVKRVEPSTGRTVTEAVGANVFVSPDHRPYAGRLGPHRCAVLDALEAAGGERRVEELQEALHRENARPRDFRRRILKPLEEAGIIECEGDVIRLAGEWISRLEDRRHADGEVEQAGREAARHRTEGESYRLWRERKERGTPKASHEAVKRTQDLRERRLREMRAEEERDRAPTPSAVEVLIERLLRQQDRIRLGLMCEIAREEGLRWRDVQPAVRRMGYRVERLPEYDNAEFVFAPAEWAAA